MIFVKIFFLFQGPINCIRIAVFGHGRVGKTSLIKQYLYNSFEEQYQETIEDIYRKDVTCNNQIFDLTILDAAGNYQFPAMRRLAIQQSAGFIIVCSIDSIVSIHEAQRLYNIILDEKEALDVPVLLVGNKIDISSRRVTRKEASHMVKSWGHKVQYIETSAKECKNVDLIFNRIIGMIDEKNNEILRDNSLRNMNRSLTFSNVRASFKHSARKISSATTKRQSPVKTGAALASKRTVSTMCVPCHLEFLPSP